MLAGLVTAVSTGELQSPGEFEIQTSVTTELLI